MADAPPENDPPRARSRRRAALVGGVAIVVAGAVVAALALANGAPDPAPTGEQWESVDYTARPDAGAAPLGSDDTPMPSGSIVVAPDAPAGGDGSLQRPLSTVADALDRVKGSGTIVLRGGVYREEVFVGRSKTVVIRSYPGEEVWFDGTDPLEGFTHDGEVWRTAWPYEFSSAPSYTGDEDGTEENWNFIDPAHPFAAHPEQVWLDDGALDQVAPDEVTTGTFAIDPETAELIIGDDPADREIVASTRQRAFEVRSPGSVLQGIGVRRYAPSVQTMGAVVLEGDGALLQDVVIEDASTSGLFVTGTGSTVKNVTIRRSGLIGATANYADNLVLARVLLEGNNTERFNQAPVSGGFKVSRSRHLVISGSVVRDNAGPGIWLDQSVFDTTILSSDVLSNAGHGVFAEISDRVRLVDVVVAGNRRIGLKINDTSDVQVWRSTIVGNGLGVAVLQDTRRASDPSIPGHDDRRPIPDPKMTWVVSDVVIADSVIGAAQGSERDSDGQPTTPIWVRDYSGEFSASDMIASISGNVFHRPSDEQVLAIWQKETKTTTTYASLAAWEKAAPEVTGNADLTGATPIDATFRLSEQARSASTVSLPLPDDVAALLGDAAEGPPGAVEPQGEEGDSDEPSASGALPRASGSSTRRRIAAPPRRAPAASTTGTHTTAPAESSSTSTAAAESTVSSSRMANT